MPNHYIIAHKNGAKFRSIHGNVLHLYKNTRKIISIVFQTKSYNSFEQVISTNDKINELGKTISSEYKMWNLV